MSVPDERLEARSESPEAESGRSNSQGHGQLDISTAEANAWWRANDPLGAFLNKFMLAFVAAPVVLVLREYYTASAIVFAFMVPYGFLVRYLAVVAVRRRIAKAPELLAEFREQGIVGGS